jgi:type VI secretion system secreted protein VgrG
VQFFWDRLGEHNENSSCWVRVSHGWAGKNWGMVFHPRIGQEVLIEFIEGDPDRPVIIGRVYNAEQMPPYELPANQTQSGVKSRSSLKGTTENFNEIRFEDKKDKEHIYIHAERNLNILVEANERRTIGYDQTLTVAHNATIKIGTKDDGDPKKDGKCTTEIFGDTSTTIKKGDLSLDVQTGKMTVNVKGLVEENFADTLTTTAKKTATLQSSDADVVIKAATEIKLECGASSITLKKDGTIEIKGKDIKISGTASVGIEGAKIDSVASAINTLKGNPVKINC